MTSPIEPQHRPPVYCAECGREIAAPSARMTYMGVIICKSPRVCGATAASATAWSLMLEKAFVAQEQN